MVLPWYCRSSFLPFFHLQKCTMKWDNTMVFCTLCHDVCLIRVPWYYRGILDILLWHLIMVPSYYGYFTMILPWYFGHGTMHGILDILSWYCHDILDMAPWYYYGILNILPLYYYGILDIRWYFGYWKNLAMVLLFFLCMVPCMASWTLDILSW